MAPGGELFAQLLEVFDDAVVHDGDAIVHVRMGVALDRLAVRCPARMAKPGAPLQRLIRKPQLQVLELALGATPVQMAVLDGGDTRRIIAAIFEPAQRIHESASHRIRSEYADDAAHGSLLASKRASSDNGKLPARVACKRRAGPMPAPCRPRGRAGKSRRHAAN